jgi:hypothetical protein
MRSSVVRENDDPLRFAKHFRGSALSPLVRAAVAPGSAPLTKNFPLHARLHTPPSRSVKQPHSRRYMNLRKPVISAGPHR